MGQRLLINEEEKKEILSKYLTEAVGPFLAAFPSSAALKSIKDTTFNIEPNSNIIFLTKRNPATGAVVPNTKFRYKVSGSYSFFDFDVNLRNFKRGADGSFTLEAKPTNGTVASLMRKLVPDSNLTKDGWLSVYIPVAKINTALDGLFKNKGVSSVIDAGNGVEIELKNV
jgi:hypothetical protein